MSTRDGDRYVLYPAYFDADEARGLRRVPEDLAVPSPDADLVAKACAQLRLKPTVERGKHHPSRWQEQEGRVLVPVRGSKAVLLRQIAEELKKIRSDED